MVMESEIGVLRQYAAAADRLYEKLEQLPGRAIVDSGGPAGRVDR
jgi:hypothetical protein